jgi:hypothetical protein
MHTSYIHMYVCMYIHTYVCMYACMYVRRERSGKGLERERRRKRKERRKRPFWCLLYLAHSTHTCKHATPTPTHLFGKGTAFLLVTKKLLLLCSRSSSSSCRRRRRLCYSFLMLSYEGVVLAVAAACLCCCCSCGAAFFWALSIIACIFDADCVGCLFGADAAAAAAALPPPPPLRRGFVGRSIGGRCVGAAAPIIGGALRTCCCDSDGSGEAVHP